MNKAEREAMYRAHDRWMSRAPYFETINASDAFHAGWKAYARAAARIAANLAGRLARQKKRGGKETGR